MKNFDYKSEIIEKVGKHIFNTISPLLNCTISIAIGSDLKINQAFGKSGYCEYLVQTKKCSAQCEQIKDNLNEKVLEVKDTVVMTCPFGIVKIVVPIKLNEKVIGAVFCCGSFKSKITQEQIEINVEKYSFKKEEYLKHIEEIDKVSDKSLKAVAKSIEKNCSLISEILYKNYLLENISKRELCLREITKMVHNSTDSDMVISELVNHLSKIFDINRIVIATKTKDNIYERDDYICAKNIHLERWASEDYNEFYNCLYNTMISENTNIIVIDKDKIASCNHSLKFVSDYWKKSGTSSLVAVKSEVSGIERLILYIRYNDDEIWTADELDFFESVSDQISIAYKLADFKTA